MKILNFAAFAALPEGTLFSHYEEGLCRGIKRKGSTISSNGSPIDFFEANMLPSYDMSESKLSVCPVESRWGIFDDNAQFAVFEEADIEALRGMLPPAALPLAVAHVLGRTENFLGAWDAHAPESIKGERKPVSVEEILEAIRQIRKDNPPGSVAARSDDVAAVLGVINELFALDPAAVHTLLVNRVPCANAILEHPKLCASNMAVTNPGYAGMTAFDLLNSVTLRLTGHVVIPAWSTDTVPGTRCHQIKGFTSVEMDSLQQ